MFFFLYHKCTDLTLDWTGFQPCFIGNAKFPITVRVYYIHQLMHPTFEDNKLDAYFQERLVKKCGTSS